MGIRLDISVETPLSDDDRDILAGWPVAPAMLRGSLTRPLYQKATR